MDRMVDLYPSRVADQAVMKPRRDPVIHSDPKDWDKGPLSREKLDEFEEKGFLAFPGFFSEDEVNEWKAELDRLWALYEKEESDYVIREPESRAVRSIFRVHRDNEVYRRVARNKRLVEMIEQILGEGIYVVQSRINFKPGFNGKEFDWHSDFETWHAEDGMPRMRAVSVNIALTANTPYNGSLMLIPGSHKTFASCAGETPENNYQSSLRKQKVGVPSEEQLQALYDEGGIEMPTGPAGSLVIFDCNTMHGSASNISPQPRSNIFFVYNSVENRLTQPFAAKAPRPDFLAEREEVEPIVAV